MMEYILHVIELSNILTPLLCYTFVVNAMYFMVSVKLLLHKVSTLVHTFSSRYFSQVNIHVISKESQTFFFATQLVRRQKTVMSRQLH